MGLYEISAPAADVVSLAEIKAHCRAEEFTDHDDYLAACVAAATKHIDGRDGWLGRALVDQTWELRFDEFCEDKIALPLPPVLEVVHIKYYDDDGELQTLATSVYHVIGVNGGRPGYVALKDGQSWPATDVRPEAVIIRFRCGYVDHDASPVSGSVPEPIKQAIMLFAGTMYANRETMVIGVSVTPMPWAAEALLAPYRVFTF